MHPHVQVNGSRFNDVSAVFQLNVQSGRGGVLSAKDICIADATSFWTFLSTDTYAGMATVKDLVTGLETRWSIAWLMAPLTAPLVRALPSTGLDARCTRLATFLLTLAVDAAVFTIPATGRAVAKARLPARVGADQKTLAPVRTDAVVASLVATVAGTFASVIAF